MAVTSSVILPAQPDAGVVSWVPLGGDGVTAPLGYYEVDLQLVGDASGGNATINITFDGRYTNLLSWANLKIFDDTAAGEFSVDLTRSAAFNGLHQVGTYPGITEAVVTVNSAWLWYPPPLFFAGDGRLRVIQVNVDATETYVVQAQVFAYDRDVRNRFNMTWLHQITPSTNAVTAS